MESFTRASGDYLYLNIKVVPGASRSELAEAREGRLKIRIAAAPENGKANEELISFFAKNLGIPKKAVTIESGEKSRLKTLRLPLSLEEKIKHLLEL